MHLINLTVNYLYRKYGVPIHTFFYNRTGGTSYLKKSFFSIQRPDTLGMQRENDISNMLLALFATGLVIHPKVTYTVYVVIFAGEKFCDNVGKTFHVGVIFTILLLFSLLRYMGFIFAWG